MNDTAEKPAGLSRRAIRLGLWLLPLAALANIGIFLWTLDGRPIASIAERPWLILFAIGLSIVPWIAMVLRLYIWARFLEVDLGWKSNFRVTLGTVIANSITPTATGGTVIKWGFLVNEGVPADKSTTIISTQVAEDTIVMLGTLAIALFIAFGFELPATLRRTDWMSDAVVSTQNALLLLGTIIISVTLLILFARRGLLGKRLAGWTNGAIAKIRDHLKTVGREWRGILKHGKSVVATSMALSFIQWGARYSVITLVIGFAGGAMLPLLYWALQWLTFTFSTLVPTPGGIGGTEAAFLLLYAPFVAPGKLPAVMVIWRLIMFYVPVAIAALLFLGLRGRVGARPAKRPTRPTRGGMERPK